MVLHPAIKKVLTGKAPRVPGGGLNKEHCNDDNEVKELDGSEEDTFSTTTVIPQYIPPKKQETPFDVPVPRGAQHKYRS